MSKDWRKDCCAICKYRENDYKGMTVTCVTYQKGTPSTCMAVMEYLQTGIAPDRIRKEIGK